MSPTALSCDELKQEFTQQIQKAEWGFLATAEGNYVTVRQMMILSDGLKIMCFTGKNTRKYKQILANKNVALAINNLQIEGIANLTGHPSDARNAGFMKTFKERFPKVYEYWREQCIDPNSGLVVIEITPGKITAYKASPTGSQVDILNIVTEKATNLSGTELSKTNYDQF
jgi:general stress protein 26